MTRWGADRGVAVLQRGSNAGVDTACVFVCSSESEGKKKKKKKRKTTIVTSSLQHTCKVLERLCAKPADYLGAPQGLPSLLHKLLRLKHILLTASVSPRSFFTSRPVATLSFCIIGLPRHLRRDHIFHLSSSVLAPYFPAHLCQFPGFLPTWCFTWLSLFIYLFILLNIAVKECRPAGTETRHKLVKNVRDADQQVLFSESKSSWILFSVEMPNFRSHAAHTPPFSVYWGLGRI